MEVDFLVVEIVAGCEGYHAKRENEFFEHFVVRMGRWISEVKL